MKFTELCDGIFKRSIADYHKTDNVDTPIQNPYEKGTIEFFLYLKNWIDTVQWHFEDIIRDPEINPEAALVLKRRIDKYKNVEVLPDATINTESPAWAIDRLSILYLKIYHMQVEVDRTDVSQEHHDKCAQKLDVLLTQRIDLTTAIDQLLDDIAAGRKYMKVYKQMKMYNDPNLNPVLYGNK